MSGPRTTFDRRGVLAGAAALLGATLAGCSTGPGTTGDAPAGGGDTTESETDEATETTSTAETTDEATETAEETTAADEGGATETTDASAEYVDEGGRATVAVGPDGGYVYSPGTETPAKVHVGTTVEFVWKSDNHNVAVRSRPDGAEWSGHEPLEDEGFTFEHTFEVAGSYEFVCTPHESGGMVGEILVE